MNLLPHSNGFHRIKPKEFNFLEICKKTVVVILALLITGFLVQSISNFISNERIKANLKYVRVDGKKLEYKIRGNGSYTIVFDGGIGNNIYQWDEICKTLESNSDIKTFVYNRQGYGFSDSGEQRSISDQVEDLRALLKKSGAYEPYIFVGEEYGSLIATTFTEKYPELVAGMVLINPLSQETINTNEYLRAIRWEYYKSKLEFIGSYFYLTELSDKLGLVEDNKNLEENIPNGALEEFNIHKNKNSYRKAIYDEFGNLYKNNFHNENTDALREKPIYIINNQLVSKIESFDENSLITLYETSVLGTPYVVKDKEAVLNAINNTLKKAKKIEKNS